jgi:uncharacterized protein
VSGAPAAPLDPFGPRPEPARRLHPAVRRQWMAQAAMPALPLVVVVPAALDLPVWLWALLVVATLAWVLVVPALRERRWRWELREIELDLRHGVLTDVRTIVPLSRVQHVEVQRTAVSRALGLADVVVHTAAGRTRIPGLGEREAAEVRDRIAGLASAPDDV